MCAIRQNEAAAPVLKKSKGVNRIPRFYWGLVTEH